MASAGHGVVYAAIFALWLVGSSSGIDVASLSAQASAGRPLTDGSATMAPLAVDATDADVSSALYLFDVREHGELLGVDAETTNEDKAVALMKLELLLTVGNDQYVWLFAATEQQRRKWPGFTGSLVSSSHLGVPTCDRKMIFCVIPPAVVQNGIRKAAPRAIGPPTIQGAGAAFKKLFEPTNLRLGLRAPFVLALLARVPQSSLAMWGAAGPASGWEPSCISLSAAEAESIADAISTSPAADALREVYARRYCMPASLVTMDDDPTGADACSSAAGDAEDDSDASSDSSDSSDSADAESDSDNEWEPAADDRPARTVREASVCQMPRLQTR